MSKLLQTRREYGEPFVEVVKGFAEMRYSKSATASTLGYNLSYFRQLLTRFDLHKYFQPKGTAQNEACRGGAKKGVPNVHRWKLPIIHNGFTWHPSEPTYHYLRQEMRNDVLPVQKAKGHQDLR